MIFRSTTILGVRLKTAVALGGDGQVTFGDMALKQKAVKVRKFDSSKNEILGGFAGAAADALTLFGKFEEKLQEYNGQLQRSVVELAKEWRTDKYLRNLDALLALMDRKQSYLVSGDGNVVEPDGPVIAVGSGAGYAQAAASALLSCKVTSPKEIVRRSLKIAADICIYTNHQITVMELK
ncbi:MAG: ATP-dependent protease subunit HslV [Candidatus Marinimicrobia bacterium]|jgi:ATP-dependent HslUV protease subunit HslV|nr:ATP-dependent protease subunit HslV [Candidatus Neomarinimicrobiota bacterium]MDP6592729.1 ATP-dependent protease subunit HslV [Candidatus Neomarinimicrobiota bacterium]MDP6835791.1 ATP-dependent protease subunit HslV [Candidatus Neomarinimicrobiota bacterium]MDP6967222.1 ATP-dependent protease subunit HslV [Candidatus Neomarinimicrobiota bacterium]|tara:strand:- start:2812 stop:3351 length:540 start_codon:yes stop_codon:yes gene_type:complete